MSPINTMDDRDIGSVNKSNIKKSTPETTITNKVKSNRYPYPNLSTPMNPSPTTLNSEMGKKFPSQSIQSSPSPIKNWKERTITSPSGRTLPLYKIWLQPDLPEDEVISGKDFFTIITDIINISQKLQYPLKRWTKAHNIFISKNPGVSKIHRLRPIHTLEAELNLFQRELITRRLMKMLKHMVLFQ